MVIANAIANAALEAAIDRYIVAGSGGCLVHELDRSIFIIVLINTNEHLQVFDILRLP
jgi:hypothetical protein